MPTEANGWSHEGIYDVYKTTELILQGTLPARSRWIFRVNLATAYYNERDDLQAAFARIQAIADNKDAVIRDGVLFHVYSQSPLVEPVRRHNVIKQLTFAIENITEDPIVLDMANVADEEGEAIPDGLLIMIGGEPGAPLWEPAQTYEDQPEVADAPGAFAIVTRFNQAVVFSAIDATALYTGLIEEASHALTADPAAAAATVPWSGVTGAPAGIDGAVVYMGTWNATSNSPNLAASSPNKGEYYVVSTAGTTSLGGVTDWNPGDWAIYNGSAWEKVDTTDAVASVNGRTGAVTGLAEAADVATALAAVDTEFDAVDTALAAKADTSDLANYVPTADVGANDGVAPLDENGYIPMARIPASLLGSVRYQGAWNASTNSPNLAASGPTKGYYYVVSTAGATSLGGIADWNVGDWAIYNGSAWEKVDSSDLVSSVFGLQGAIGIGSFTAEATADNADYIIVYDASAAAWRKMLRSDFLAGITGASGSSSGADLYLYNNYI